MRVLRFLLILLVSILFSVNITNRFLLLQIVEVYNEENRIQYSLRQW